MACQTHSNLMSRHTDQNSTIQIIYHIMPFSLRKNGYDFNDCNNVRDILYNTDIIIFVFKLIVHSPVGKLV